MLFLFFKSHFDDVESHTGTAEGRILQILPVIISRGIFLILFCFLLINTPLTAQADFTSSNLPIIIIDTHGEKILDSPKITADMGIIDKGEGSINYVTDSCNVYNGKIGIEIRGHSSQMFPKKQYGIELRDSAGNSINSSLLGMPSESDWVLNASYTDKTFLRNVLAYKLCNDMGRYASRTRFCEIVLNDEYIGLYILQEKVKRDKNRVNIKKLEAADTSGDNLTGGYIMKIDRIDPGDKYFNSVFPSVYPKLPHQPSPISYIHVYPNAANILPVQQEYIKDYITQFETTLSAFNYKDPFTGYYDYIDMDAAADYVLINEFVKTVDAYRLSFYIYKNRDSNGGKLTFGPIWDHDLSFGLADYAGAWLSSGWEAEIDPYEGIWSIPFWINKIFQDPVFKNKLEKRWNESKLTVFNLKNILDYIDKTVLEIKQARIRNFIRWPIIGEYQWPEYYVGETYDKEVLYLKGWIIRRFNWIDNNLTGNYSDIEWQAVDFSKISLEEKLPFSVFAKNMKGISALEFLSPDSNIDFKVENDSVAVTINKPGDYIFKIIAKNDSEVVSISPEYKIEITTGINHNNNNIKEFRLYQNYPNPFNPATLIKYSLAEPAFVKITLYDMLGRKIKELYSGEQDSGLHEINFDASELENGLSSGFYLYTLTASYKNGNFRSTKKMILLK